MLLDYFIENKIKFKTLYLVGDIIENWYFSGERRLSQSMGRKRFDKLFDRFDKIVSDHGLKIYIIGNHDSTSYDMGLPRRIENYLFERRWQVLDRFETDELVVLHGHQGQYSRLKWVVDIFLVRFINMLACFIPGLFKKAEEFYDKHLNHEDHSDAEFRLQYYSRLSEIVEQKNRLLVCGHTHEFFCLPELRIMNTGNWVTDKTFIVQQKKTFTGLRMLSKKEFEKVYSFRLT